jgi:flagellar secretion chaperone FliS
MQMTDHSPMTMSSPPQPAEGLNLVIRCYDTTINNLTKARELHLAGDFDATQDNVRLAQDLVTELLLGLDYEKGGDIAQNLGRIYNFLLRELITINGGKDATVYDPLIRILSDLKEAWVEISRQ